MANSHRKCAYKPCPTYVRVSEAVIAPNGKVFCIEEHKIAFAITQAPKTKQKLVREFKRETTRRRKAARANDLPHQLGLTRRSFNTMIRWLDKGKLCPTCNEPLTDGYYDAGHVRTVAACPQLRFDARNCFGQCTGCNGTGLYRKKTRQTQETVIERYKAWVLATLGHAHYDWLFGPHDSPKWTCDDLAAMRALFDAETRRLKAGLEPSREWRALPNA